MNDTINKDKSQDLATKLVNELYEQGLIKNTDNVPHKIFQLISGTIEAINKRFYALEVKVGIDSPNVKREITVDNNLYSDEKTNDMIINYAYESVKATYTYLTQEELETLKDRLRRVKSTDTLDNINFIIKSVVNRGK